MSAKGQPSVIPIHSGDDDEELDKENGEATGACPQA